MSTDQSQHSPPPQAFALWNLGFRPFYLLAGLFAALSVGCWAAQFAGWLGPHIYLTNPLWHAHEMIFGYAFAVIVGFLFTAGRNWTNRHTPTGAALAAIATLWLAGRVRRCRKPWRVLIHGNTRDQRRIIFEAIKISLPAFIIPQKKCGPDSF